MPFDDPPHDRQTDAVALELAGVQAPVVSYSATQAIAVVPQNATSGPIALTAAGQTGNSSAAFSVTSTGTGTATVTISGVQAEPSVVGQGYSVTAVVSAPGGTPTGTVFVADQNGNACAIELPGTGCFMPPPPSNAVGEVTIVAAYSGDTAYESAVSNSVEHRRPQGVVKNVCQMWCP